MPSSLVIVESPAKAKTIGKYLGRNYVVKASLGHIKDLPKREVYVCPICGNTVYDSAPDQCSVCKAKGSTFIKI